MPNPDLYAYRAEQLKDQFSELRDKIMSYKGSMTLVNSKSISSDQYQTIINYLYQFDDDHGLNYQKLNELVQQFDIKLSNDINNNSTKKLTAEDKELLDLMRSVRDGARNFSSPLCSYLRAEKTIEKFHLDYYTDNVQYDINNILAKTGFDGKKPDINKCQSLSVLGSTPEELMPQLLWLTSQEAKTFKAGINTDAVEEHSLYKDTFDRLLEELQQAPTDVQAEYAVYLTKYQMGLRAEAKRHYDDYFKNAPQGQDPEFYAIKKLAQDPVYWACSNANHFTATCTCTRMADICTVFLKRQSLGPSPVNNESFTFIGGLIQGGMKNKLEDYIGKNPECPSEAKEKGKYISKELKSIFEPETTSAKRDLETNGFVVSSAVGTISYAYAKLINDKSKNGTLYNSMKYAFNKFAELNHEDIGELSRKNYYKQLDRAENAVRRYLASFEGKNPKGKDLENFNLAAKMKHALSEHRSIISETDPLPQEHINTDGVNAVEKAQTIGAMIKELEKVDPGFIRSSKEFKAIKTTLKEFQNYAKDLDMSKELKLDQMEAIKEYCQLLNLQTEAYIELKEDPARSPKQDYAKEGTNTKARYDFAKQLQETVKVLGASVAANEKQLLGMLNEEKAKGKEVDTPITVAEYLEKIEPNLDDQIELVHKIAIGRYQAGNSIGIKAKELIETQYNFTDNDTALEYAFEINNLRDMGLRCVRSDISIAVNSLPVNGLEDAKENPELTLNLNIKKPNALGLSKLIKAEILEDRLMNDPHSLDGLDRFKYEKLNDLVIKFVENKYSEPGDFNAVKPMSADRLLKDFCTSSGAQQRLKEFDDFVKENKLSDPTKQVEKQKVKNM